MSNVTANSTCSAVLRTVALRTAISTSRMVSSIHGGQQHIYVRRSDRNVAQVDTCAGLTEILEIEESKTCGRFGNMIPCEVCRLGNMWRLSIR